MGITKLILKHILPLPDITKYERYLFIGPHLDDIEIGAGATAAKLAEEGKQICFLICTDGRFGTANAGKNITPDELVRMRKKEALSAAKALGVSDVRFLGLSDGGLYEQSELISGIAGAIGDFRPDIILCPDPDVTSECHIDHLNTGNAARQMAFFAPFEDIMKEYGAPGAADVKALACFMTAKPNSFVCTKGFLDRQISAVFENYVSQFPSGCEDGENIRKYLRLRAFDFGLRKLCGTAEGFRVLGTAHMHCVPEAGN